MGMLLHVLGQNKTSVRYRTCIVAMGCHEFMIKGHNLPLKPHYPDPKSLLVETVRNS